MTAQNCLDQSLSQELLLDGKEGGHSHIHANVFGAMAGREIVLHVLMVYRCSSLSSGRLKNPATGSKCIDGSGWQHAADREATQRRERKQNGSGSGSEMEIGIDIGTGRAGPCGSGARSRSRSGRVGPERDPDPDPDLIWPGRSGS